jgi:hypothetical protein
MPTLIDSLIVEIGIDAKNFTKGQQDAVEAANHALESIEANAKGMEHEAKRSMDALGGIKTQAIELFAIFTGGKGLIDFSSQLTHSNASLGRLERNIGVSASTISKWQGAARIFGGDAASMAQSFTAVSDALAGWKIGIISPMVADFRAISTAGGTVIDVNKGVEQSFLDLSANLKAIHDRDPATAGLLGRKLGLDPALFDLLIKGPGGVKQVLDYVNKIGVATHEDVDAFGELEKRMSQMGLKAESLARNVLGGEHGGASRITALADELSKPFLEAKPWDAIFQTGEYATGKPALFPGAAPGASPSTEGGAFASPVEKEQFIRQSAIAAGNDPDKAVKVARSEGFSQFYGDNNTSFGAFQLHVTPGGRGHAVGDEFQRLTGLDPSDPKNERATIMFAMEWAKRHGWSDFHGAARVGIGNWEGIGGNQGARPWDAAGGGSTTTTTTKIDVNGPVTINAGSGADGAKIAGKFVQTLKGQSFAAQANGGQN